MSKCKACGKEIKWVDTASGKKMPVNPQKIPYKAVPNGGLTLITLDGRIANAALDLDSDKYGYESHFATCPAADSFRRRGKE